MPEEDNPRLTQVGAGQNNQRDHPQIPPQLDIINQESGKDRVFDQTQTKFEGSF